MVFRNNGIFKPEEQKELYNTLYQITLNKVLEHAHEFNKFFDYYQMRDEGNNGWDIFYYGHANRAEITKNAKAFMVVNGWQVGDKIEFTHDDTQKIIHRLQKDDYSGSEKIIKMR